MTPRPPIVLRFFARFVPGDLREPIAGDLAEEYLVMRDRRGPARATLWSRIRRTLTSLVELGSAIVARNCA